MSRLVQAPRRSAPLHPMSATMCGLVSLGLLLSLPVAAVADPTLAPLPRPGGAGWWTVLAVLVIQAVAVMWVGRFPETVLPGLTAVPLVLFWGAAGAAFSLTAVAELAGVFLAVLARPLRGMRVALPVTVLLLATAQFLNEVGSATSDIGMAITGALLQALVVVGLPLLLALVIASQRHARDARDQEVRALRREQDALLQAAVSRQRVTMSRELHDIAAHHLSGIALMAAAIDRQVDSAPATAKQSARQIREQASSILDDLRRLVGLLREEADASRPLETLDAVSALVESRRAAGAEIDLIVPEGDPEPTGVGSLARLVVYRMVQEALANAAVHAPGARCTVEIGTSRESRLTITVRNSAPTGSDPGPGGGFGLVGMAERARLVGADLTYGATPDGGWEVALTVPVDDTTSTMRAPMSPLEDLA